MKEILKEFKSIIKTVFTKDNLVKFMVYSFMALPLILLFIGFFLVPSNASPTTTQSPEYEDGYNDGYNDGYDDGYQDGVNDSTNNLIDQIDLFSAISLYYDSAILFMSTNGGATYENVMSQNYEVVFNQTSLKVGRTSNQSWNSSAWYYLTINFTQPINIDKLRLPGDNRPREPQKVVVNERNYSFTFGYIDGVSYLMTYNMLTGLTNHLDFYFKMGSDTTGGLNYFYVYVDGFIVRNDYQLGYDNGVADSQVIINQKDTIIEQKNANINILKTEIESLQNQLSQGVSSWQSIFFAMADTPFKTASNFLGFEIFGVNLFNALIGFITVLAVFWVFKRLVK